MGFMFQNAKHFDCGPGDMNGWEVYNVKDMAGMFESAESFENDLEDWAGRLGSCKNMYDMFTKAIKFDLFCIKKWDLKSIEDDLLRP